MTDSLRFIIFGSVDVGKQTLIDSLPCESRQIFDDHMNEIASARYCTQGITSDFELLVDGLQPEREQGVAIDLACRFFSTEKRKFIVVDTPNHQQYTLTMLTRVATVDLAVLLIEARNGLLVQTKRQCRIFAMLGIRHVVLAINKMDVVDWNQSIYNSIVADFNNFISDFGFSSTQVIPLSALTGENVAHLGDHISWYHGPTLIEYLERVDITKVEVVCSFRMPVQFVNNSNIELRGYCGTIASGSVSLGMPIRVAPSGTEARVKSIVVGQSEENTANTGDAVTITLDRELDVSRGQVLSGIDDPIQISDQFEASVICFSEHNIIPGRSYLIKLHTAQVGVTITEIKYKLEINQGAHLACHVLEYNDIGEITLYTSHAVAFETYRQNKNLGAFVLIDRITNETVGAGIINYALRRAANLHWQALDINKEARARLKSQIPSCIWFTGLSGSGKSTIANLLEKQLYALGRHTYLLDGDNVRHGLNRDLGFTEADRVENIRRVAETSKLMVDAGLMVIVAFISPFRAERDFARSLFEPGKFIEIFVDTPFDICEKRDVKGIYAKARRGQVKNFTGIDIHYEKPELPEIHLEASIQTSEQCVDQIVEVLKLLKL